MGIVTGPVRPGDGITPAVALVDPKFPHNLSAAVYTVLYDRHAKRVHAGLEPRNAPSSGSSDHNGPSDSSEPLTGFDEPDSMAPATGLTWSR